MIKFYLKQKQREWDRNLVSLAGAYQATPHESIKMTLNQLMLGRENQLPIKVILGTGGTSTREAVTSYVKSIDDLSQKVFG